MVFNSPEFVVFIVLFFVGWAYVRKWAQPKWIYITLASLVFYGWWDWRFLFLIIGSGLLDYYAGILIAKHPPRAKLFLAVSLVGNIGSLAIFKYSVFAATAIESVILTVFGFDVGLKERIPEFALILPVGISFYTFQSMSYTIDVYMGRIKPVQNVGHFFAFLVMFPQLVAGPIVRAKDLLGQLEQYRPVSDSTLWIGIRLFVLGLFQKAVIADNLAPLVDPIFKGTAPVNGALAWWVATIAFAFQIYCDFSGYSLMARGLARMMGFHFKMNFNHPYLATSMRGFWSRWHISLSTWFRDYVYIPLGGNRLGLWHGLANMAITMLLSGIWHGANWTFLAWGALHGMALSIERVAGPSYKLLIPWQSLRTVISRMLVLLVVLVGWVFFRAESIEQAFEILGRMFSFGPMDGITDYFSLELIFLGLAISIELGKALIDRNARLTRVLMRHPILDALLIGVVAVVALFFRGPDSTFIYFQF